LNRLHDRGAGHLQWLFCPRFARPVRTLSNRRRRPCKRNQALGHSVERIQSNAWTEAHGHTRLRACREGDASIVIVGLATNQMVRGLMNPHVFALKALPVKSVGTSLTQCAKDILKGAIRNLRTVLSKKLTYSLFGTNDRFNQRNNHRTIIATIQSSTPGWVTRRVSWLAR
jgi:hypothetical protein